MTAEVAVLNTGAISLAADSAVTIGTQKIYNSAIKLFAISKVAPVAVMVYGNASLLDVPWELIVKEYRKELGLKTFGTLNEYAESFIEYVEKNPKFITAESSEDWLTTRTIQFWVACREHVEEQLEEKLQNAGGIDQSEIEIAFINEISQRIEKLSARDDLPRVENAVVEVERVMGTLAENYGTQIFGDKLFPRISDSLVQIGILIFKKDIFPQNTSGVVVAGYGEEEIFPGLVTHKVEGGLPGYLRRKLEPDKSQTISVRTPAAIVPFAQDDMVATFMEGINPGFAKYFNAQIGELFASLPVELSKSIGGRKEAVQKREIRLRALCEKIETDLLTMLESHRYEGHIHPVLQMVGVLPKNELAEMAETLVNLTAFKRRVTHSVESVGGPVDVCVISKGDGLVWVRRKHYFPSELNHLFHVNYARGLS